MKQLLYFVCAILLTAAVSCKKKTAADPSGISFTYGGIPESGSISLENASDSIRLLGTNQSTRLLIAIPQPAALSTVYTFPTQARLRFSQDNGATYISATSGSLTITEHDDKAMTGTFTGTVVSSGVTIQITSGSFQVNF